MKTGLAPLVAFAALILSSVSAGRYKPGLVESSTDLMNSPDSYVTSPNSQNVAEDTGSVESTGTLGESVVAAQETELTDSTEFVTMSPELKKRAGIENGPIDTNLSGMSEQSILEGITGSTSGDNAPIISTEAQEKEDPQTTKNGGTDSTRAPNSVPQASTPLSGDDESTASKPIETPVQPSPATDDDQYQSKPLDTPQSTPAATSTTDFSQSDDQWKQPPISSVNQWTQPPNQSSNQQPTQAPNNEAPQPSQPAQPPQSEAPQPTQPDHGGWKASATNDSQINWQGGWGSETQPRSQPTPAPTTAFDSSKDSAVPSEPSDYASSPATFPPVSKCTVRR